MSSNVFLIGGHFIDQTINVFIIGGHFVGRAMCFG